MWILPLCVEKVSSIIRTLLTYNYPSSLVAWYMYEYFLTLHIEVEVIWKSKFSLTAILFLINRYAYLLQQSFQLMLDIVSAQNTKVSDLVTEI